MIPLKNLAALMRKRPKTIYITAFLALCFITAFYYFALTRDVEQDDTALYSPEARVSKEISNRLQALEAGLKENRNLLDTVRAKVDQVSKSVYFDQGSQGSRLAAQCPGDAGKTQLCLFMDPHS